MRSRDEFNEAAKKFSLEPGKILAGRETLGGPEILGGQEILAGPESLEVQALQPGSSWNEPRGWKKPLGKKASGRMTFDEWVECLERIVFKQLGVSLEDLPDLPLRDWYVAKHKPVEAYELVKDEMEIDQLEMDELDDY